MAQLIVNAIMVGVFLTIIVEIPIGIVIYWLWKYGQRQLVNELAYDKLYIEIQQDITDMPTISGCYDVIMNKLITLGNMKWKNNEKTVVLANSFYKKHMVERLRRAIDNIQFK